MTLKHLPSSNFYKKMAVLNTFSKPPFSYCDLFIRIDTQPLKQRFFISIGRTANRIETIALSC